MTLLEQVDHPALASSGEDSLLTAVLAAHGGLENWSRITRLTAELSLGGPFWAARGWPDVYGHTVATIDPHHEHITFAPFPVSGHMSVFETGPERMTIRTLDGRLIEERLSPRNSFPDSFDPAATAWDAVQVAYFTSAAVWNYLTAPFVFARPDVIAREIAPWIEEGQTWRRLAVTFPESIANHNADQVFYYDDAFLLRRMDYSPNVTGNPPVAHYAYDHACFDGFVFPTRRRVLLHDVDGIAGQAFVPITIHVASVQIERE